MSVTPYQDSNTGKKIQVEQMFDRIAFRYDLLNRVLSMGIDKGWRKKAVHALTGTDTSKILDVATGTADLAITTAAKFPGASITGLDLSENMLREGSKKIETAGLSHRITLKQGDSENMPFADNTFGAITVAFGVRNFENLEKGLKEMQRVLKPGGKAVILEFSMPQKFPVRNLYKFYFTQVLPRLGAMISGDGRAYKYLPESVEAFPSGSRFLDLMNQCGFKELTEQKLMAGIASIYTGIK